MVLSKRQRVSVTVVIALAAMAVSPCAAFAQAQDRYHGVALDENHRLIIEQMNNMCRIGIVERTRSTGPDLVDVAKPEPGMPMRATPEPTYLLEIRSEITVKSAPNYLQNPGERYRISLQTVDLAPPYENSFEVWADSARDAVLYEFYKLATEHTGIERQALETAGPLVLEVFKEAQVLPAEIYTSVLRSRSGLFRITPETQQRRSVLPPQTFAPRPNFGRPELGATMRERQRRMLPTGATAPGAVAGPATPGTTAAAAPGAAPATMPKATLSQPIKTRAAAVTQKGPKPVTAPSSGKTKGKTSP